MQSELLTSSLEGYLSGSFVHDRQDIDDIENTLKDVGQTFGATFRAGKWPYAVKRTSHLSTLKVESSHGTSAMILGALGRLLGKCDLHFGTFIADKLIDDKELRSKWDDGADWLAASIRAVRGTKSGFGDNDPLTISHLASLLGTLSTTNTSICALRDRGIIPECYNRIESLADIAPPRRRSFRGAVGKTKFAIDGFITLRIVRAYLDLTGSKRFPNTGYRRFFESTLHDQLSFSAIPDSRFDPAELTFCLEGLLLCAPEAVDAPLFGQVMKVLLDKQNTSAHWRPNKPFVYDDRGRIMLPLSVEGANSLIRSVRIADGDRLHNTFTPAAIPMLRRFWEWLRARKAQFIVDGLQLTGWHSEHINDPGLIHLWDTSQVVDFLLGYRDLLRRHVARETLVASRAGVREPSERHAWTTVAQTFEPLKSTPELDRIYDEIGNDFILGWETGEPTNYSMLLYGPPGTGKSTVAENIADSLGYRLITITVSDFLGSGGEMVEARAKAVFEMLGAQSKCVILFDEVDAFLLDRDSEYYREQSTLFQFLTPGMLTKLNELRKLKRSIFIIATNYANRIDPAIKRLGRIDRQYLLLPPDLHKRAQILAFDLLKGRCAPLTVRQLAALSEASVYLGYKDLEGAVRRAGGKDARPSRLYAELKGAARSTSPQHYFRRLETEPKYPTDELRALFILAGQARKARNVSAEIRNLSRIDQEKLAAVLDRAN